ncbi:MAG TPA: dihydrolipoyl dehydrogenase, partial [Bdellovibrionales bacterium]|nr:dihydrolipoyl dehydrogenase [Bdellovibrionales bacterium]
MAEDNQFDLIIIGAGPAGYTGAIRAAQLGLKTAIIEKDKTLGGTCLNVGCIPSKALLDSSEHFAMATHGDFATHGLKFSKVELDLPTMMGRKEKIVKDLTNGIAFLMKKNKVTVFNGWGTIKASDTVEVKLDSETKTLKTRYIMIATGSVPIDLPYAKIDGKVVVTSTEALSLPKVPESMVVIGGGAIGLEMGSVWMRLGAKVTVVEYAPMIAGASDQQTAKSLHKVLSKQGMEFLLNTAVTNVSVSGGKATVQFQGREDKKPGSIEADVVLVAVGRKAYTDKLGLENVGIDRDDRGRVNVDSHLRTKVPNIYAVGDAIIGPMLAHKAEDEAVAVAEMIGTGHGHVNYETVPSIIYTWPELASVGASEEQLKERGVDYRAGSFPFTPNARAKAIGTTDGQVKILA